MTAQVNQVEEKTRQNNIKGEGESFNPQYWIGEIENLAEKFNRDDPGGGCWEWVKSNLADKWGELMTAMHDIDAAFEGRRAGEICKLLIFVKALYGEIVEAWRTRPENVGNS